MTLPPWTFGRVLGACGFTEIPMTERIPLLAPGDEIRMSPVKIYLDSLPIEVMKPDPAAFLQIVLPADTRTFPTMKWTLSTLEPAEAKRILSLSASADRRQRKRGWRLLKHRMRAIAPPPMRGRTASFIVQDEIDSYQEKNDV
jgi:hypothetical protein